MENASKRLATSFAGAALAVLTIIGSADAGIITTYTDRGMFPGNDALDWGQLGAPSQILVISAPFSAISIGGLTINVTQPGNSPFQRRDEGNGWDGLFTLGEHLLWNRDTTAEMDFSAAPIAGFGTAIQDDLTGPYSATLSAFNGMTLLGSITVSAVSMGGHTGTAPFAGITDSVAEINRILITTSSGDTNPGVAINSLSLLTPAVPEPAS